MHRFLRDRAPGLACFPLVAALADPMCPSAPKDKPQGPGSSALAKAEVVVAESMSDHFTFAIAVDDAVIAGRLDQARKAAGKLLAASPTTYPAEWMPWVLQMRDAAHQAETATDMATAGKAVAEIVAACGACHSALGRGPAFIDMPAPAADAPTMEVHRWAAERMWEGVVGPSDLAWRAGTARFPVLPDCTPDVGGEIVDQAAINTAREQVSALTATAAGTMELRPRAALYGEYVATCATCHRSGC